MKFLKHINRISTIDKYILSQIIEVFLLGIVVFTSIIFASDTFVSLIKQISMYGMSINIAIMIILLNLPAVIVLTIPMSVLFATVMTINKMCLQSEITVMKACGISLKRIARPVFLFAALMAILTFAINETIVPATMSQSKTLALYAMVQRNIPNGKRNFTIKELTEGNKLKRLFYVAECHDKMFSNVSILDLSDADNIQILEAKTGTSVPEGWQFNKASVYNISKQGKNLSYSWIEKTIADFGSDIQRQLNKKNDGTDYNIFELLPYAFGNDTQKIQISSEDEKELKEDEAEHKKDKIKKKILTRYKVRFWEKAALPITTFVFVLVGIPLAITPPRVRHNRGFLFSIGIIFCYYVIRALSMSLGYNAIIPAFIAANLPNIIIGIAGYFMYKNKAEKN